MKNGLRYVVGKRIAGVVVAESERPPRQQVFLVFTDGTCFELYGESFRCCSGLDDAAHIEGYVESNRGRMVAVYGQSPPRSAPIGPEAQPDRGCSPQTLEARMSRDLAAWDEAKAAIKKAKGWAG